ncbi:MAG: peptidoglycan synthetase [Bacteroidales bacterium]|nr:peptidoglycan synthetase [Bacteroidales bacterium]
MKRIHFIAIGGAAMHNLAIALKLKGYQVTGSDDAISEPSYSRLKAQGLLPEEAGWYPGRIENDKVAVILGMHARKDNPELIRAMELGARIYSYPEFLYEQTRHKKRVVIAGSHGKTTLTAMVIHVLSVHKRKFDFMVGSQIEGFENMVSLNEDSEIAVFEGDEYLSSPLDLRPKFIHYRPDIALITGIAWDHINVFPDFGIYKQQFRDLMELLSDQGQLILYKGDGILLELASKKKLRANTAVYAEHPYVIEGNKWFLTTESGDKVPVNLFGRHNMQNISGAREICRTLGIGDDAFYQAIASFPGTQRRLQVLCEKKGYTAYLDFAHSPSKLKATLDAIREKHPDEKLTALFELHTFSSLSEQFLPQYSGTMEKADEAVVYLSYETLRKKGMKVLDKEFLMNCFNKRGMQVIDNRNDLEEYLRKNLAGTGVFAFMSSGSFSGIEIRQFLMC